MKKKFAQAISAFDDYISKGYFKPCDCSIVEKVSKPFVNTPLEGLPIEAIKAFEYYNNVEQAEYFQKLHGTFFIEPFNGWILKNRKREYCINSFPYSFLKSLPSFYNIKFKKNKVIKIDRLISLRYNFFNYWHFFNDVLGQLAYIDDIEANVDIPILVPYGVFKIPYVNEIINRSNKLKNRNWIEHQHGTIIQTETVITAKNLPNTKENFLKILDLIQSDDFHGYDRYDRKVFITRRNDSNRSIDNIHEIEMLVKTHGYEVIDNDLLSFEEQFYLYKSVSHVIAIHGAGLTNLLFRYPLELRLLEIFPAELIPPHYYWLCNEMGFTYSCVIGKKSINGKFYLNPDDLSNCLRSF
ncbi:MAG TPA: glycosyltransferase family 61 protein [Mucilaginibacter sp.]|nr:glycosyltransferase family 61 protein [Mucilaginibacter sp.]